MSRDHLLLVDSDPQNLQIMEASLRKAGFQVTTSSEARDALDKAVVLEPDLVLSEMELTGLDGLGLLEALRSKPQTASIPVVFLTQDAPADRDKALQAGVADYLTKPVYMKEVVARIRVLLEASDHSPSERPEPSEETGALADMGLVDVLRTLESQTGVVSCVGTEGESAAIWIRNGQVEDAELGQMTGEAAFFRLLNWADAQWRFRPSDYGRQPRITRPTDRLLSDGQRRSSEWARQLATLPGLHAVYEVDFVVLASRLGEVPDEVNAVLRLLDGRRTIAQVVEGSPFADAETLQKLNKLVGDRLVRRVGGDSAPVVAVPRKLPKPVEPPPIVTPADAPDESAADWVWTPADAESDAVSDPALEAAAADVWTTALSDGDEASDWAYSADSDNGAQAPRPLSAFELDAILAEEAPVAWSEATQDLIEVMRYPARAGSRRKRLEEEARLALENTAKRGEPLQVASDEALSPGARADGSLEQRVAASESDPSEAVTMPALASFKSPDSTIENDDDDEDFSHLVGGGFRRGPMIAVGVLVAVAVGLFYVFDSTTSPPTADVAKPDTAEAPARGPKPAPELELEPKAEHAEASEALEAEPDDEAPPEDEVVESDEPAVFVPPAPKPVAKPVAKPKPAVSKKNQVARLVENMNAATKAGNWTQAASAARQVLALEPKHAVAFRELGKAQYNGNQLEQARASLVQATRQAPSDADSFMYLGIVYQELDRTQEAGNAYERFLQLEPTGSSRYKDIAAVLENMER